MVWDKGVEVVIEVGIEVGVEVGIEVGVEVGVEVGIGLVAICTTVSMLMAEAVS